MLITESVAGLQWQLTRDPPFWRVRRAAISRTQDAHNWVFVRPRADGVRPGWDTGRRWVRPRSGQCSPGEYEDTGSLTQHAYACCRTLGVSVAASLPVSVCMM